MAGFFFKSVLIILFFTLLGSMGNLSISFLFFGCMILIHLELFSDTRISIKEAYTGTVISKKINKNIKVPEYRFCLEVRKDDANNDDAIEHINISYNVYSKFKVGSKIFFIESQEGLLYVPASINEPLRHDELDAITKNGSIIISNSVYDMIG